LWASSPWQKSSRPKVSAGFKGLHCLFWTAKPLLPRPASECSVKRHNIEALNDRRKQLRRNLTPAEAFLWTFLQKSKLDGRKFRRQHSIGPYIADFYCPECRVIVELDGQVHSGVLAQERDFTRSDYFRSLGIRVIRFENRLVFENIETVLAGIAAALKR